MATTTLPQSVSVFSNKFIETFSPERLSNIQETTYSGGSSIATYGALSCGVIVALIGILAFIYMNREMFSDIVKHNMLWFYLGKPNEIHAVEIPENSKANHLYDNNLRW
jgi:hypothetical protein